MAITCGEDLQLLSVEDVCGLLLLSRNTVYALVADQKLSAVRNGRKLAFTRQQVADYIEAQSAPVVRTPVQRATVRRRSRTA